MENFLFFFFAFGFQVTTGKFTVVQTCPKTKFEWDTRSSMFTCVDEDTRYHCVMDSTWNLVEGCINPLNITGKNKGCPTVYIFQSRAYWIFPFTPCSTENVGCPQEDHGEYSSEQLFKYPACFLNGSERALGYTTVSATTTSSTITKVSTSSVHLDKFYRSDVAYVHFANSAVLLLLVILIIITIVLYRRIRKRIEKAVSQDVSRGTSQNNIFAVNCSKETGYSHLPYSLSTYQTSAPSINDGEFSTQRKFVENRKSSLSSIASTYKTSTTSNDEGGSSPAPKFVENWKYHLPSIASIKKTSTTSNGDGASSLQQNWKYHLPSIASIKKTSTTSDDDGGSSPQQNRKSSLPRIVSINKTSTTSNDDGGSSPQPKYVEKRKSSLPSSASTYKTSTTANDDGGFSLQLKYVGRKKKKNGKVFFLRNKRKGWKRQSQESDPSFA